MTTESLHSLSADIDREAIAFQRVQEETASTANSQQALFELPNSPIVSQLRSTLQSVRGAFNEFWSQPDKFRPEDGPGQANSHAKNVCTRMTKALNLGRLLKLRIDVPETLRKWLDAISRHKPSYAIGLTFSSKDREAIIDPVANVLGRTLTRERVFYDKFHEAFISRLNAKDLLSEIYVSDCELVVVFLSSSYGEGWTGMEWGKVAQLALTEPHRVVLVKLTDFDASKLGIREDTAICWDIRKDRHDGTYRDPEDVGKEILRVLMKIGGPDAPSTPEASAVVGLAGNAKDE